MIRFRRLRIVRGILPLGALVLIGGCGAADPANAPLAFASDQLVQAVERVQPDSGGLGIAEPAFSAPGFVRMHGDSVWVLDSGRRTVFLFDTTGRYRGRVGHRGRGAGELSIPSAMDVARDGTVWVLDVGNGKAAGFVPGGDVREFTLDFQPAGLAASANGEVWIAGDLNASLFVRYSATGVKLGTVGHPAARGLHAFRSNQGIAVGGAGDCAVVWAYAYRSILECYEGSGRLRWHVQGPVRVEWPDDAPAFRMSESDVNAYADVAATPEGILALFVGATGAPHGQDVHRFSLTDGTLLGVEKLPLPTGAFARQAHRWALVAHTGSDEPSPHLFLTRDRGVAP